VTDHRVSTVREIEEIAATLEREANDNKPDELSYISPILYRGQARSSWTLQTTLERAGKSDLHLNDYIRYIARVKPAIEALTSQKFQFAWGNEQEEQTRFMLSRVKLLQGQYEFMVYLRHHGFPTPLLDWSRSLYVALYFALCDATEAEPAALYMYIESLGHGKGGVVGSPEISSTGKEGTAHKRHRIQQSDYQACVAKNDHRWFLPKHENVLGGPSDLSDRLVKVAIDPSANLSVLRALDRMNVNAFSLYGTEEALMRTLAFRELQDDDL